MDGDGTLRHLPEAGAYRDQPEYDMRVIRVIRNTWNRLKNEEMRRRHGK